MSVTSPSGCPAGTKNPVGLENVMDPLTLIFVHVVVNVILAALGASPGCCP